MQAKERRGRHFKSSVGLMLNENYGDGLVPNTVQNQDFLYMPATDYPVSGTGWAFLEAKLGEQPHVHKPRSIGTSDSLYQAYRRAFGQPVGMVHYDRDPLYWQSKPRPGSDTGSFSVGSSRLRNYDAIFNGYERGSNVPDEHPASTPKSVSTAKSSRSVATRPASDITKASSRGRNSEDDYRLSSSKVSLLNGKVEDNRHRLWTPGSEAGGFKPYSPFSDSLQDFGKKEAKYISPEIKPEFDRTCDVIPAPVYKNALNKVLDSPEGTAGGNWKKNKADILKLHGNPEYPENVMDDKDVPNYIAWAKIYPYCPLTQVEGQEKPVFVPPRGFTPSTPSTKGSIPKLRDMKKEKRKIMEGIKLLSASSSARRAGKGSPKRQQADGGVPDNDAEIHPSLKALPPSLAAKLNPVLKKDEGDSKPGHTNNRNIGTSSTDCNRYSSNDIKDNRPTAKVTFTSPAAKSPGYYDPRATRKILDMKMKAPTGWYGGQTPSHTPTPDPSLPIKADRAWVKHYSPARVRHFMRAINGDPSTPQTENF